MLVYFEDIAVPRCVPQGGANIYSDFAVSRAMRIAWLFGSAAATIFLGLVWTLGQMGLPDTNRHLCEAAHHWWAPVPENCQASDFIVKACGVLALCALVSFLIAAGFNFCRWLAHRREKRNAEHAAKQAIVDEEARKERAAQALLKRIEEAKARRQGYSPQIQRDVWLLDAIWRAFEGAWSSPKPDFFGLGIGKEKSQSLHDLIAKTFRQVAFDGKLPIWAKREGSNLWEQVPPEFWRTHKLNYLTVMRSKPEDVRAESEDVLKLMRTTDMWREFMTCRSVIDELFPVNRVTSKLLLSTGEAGHYFKTDSRMIWLTKRTLNLSVENIDTEKAISDIRIVVTAIEPETEYHGPWVLAEGFSLPAGGHKIFPFARFGEASDAPYETSKFDRCDSFIELLTGLHGPAIPKDMPSIVSIRATGMETAPCDYRCKIWVDREAGRLRIMDA